MSVTLRTISRTHFFVPPPAPSRAPVSACPRCLHKFLRAPVRIRTCFFVPPPAPIPAPISACPPAHHLAHLFPHAPTCTISRTRFCMLSRAPSPARVSSCPRAPARFLMHRHFCLRRLICCCTGISGRPFSQPEIPAPTPFLMRSHFCTCARRHFHPHQLPFEAPEFLAASVWPFLRSPTTFLQEFLAVPARSYFWPRPPPFRFAGISGRASCGQFCLRQLSFSAQEFWPHRFTAINPRARSSFNAQAFLHTPRGYFYLCQLPFHGQEFLAAPSGSQKYLRPLPV
ncbi:hypothetical protein DFH09DRAFT_1328100 [Mycena vulgaris]|nr:hypothetical protein DFH09DRAFT_1328100 [Mycena vulgaris]